MKLFNASFQRTILRYYLLMTVAIVPFFLGVPVLAILALPIFLLTITGSTLKKPASKKAATKQLPNEVANKDLTRVSKKLAY